MFLSLRSVFQLLFFLDLAADFLPNGAHIIRNLLLQAGVVFFYNMNFCTAFLAVHFSFGNFTPAFGAFH